MVCSCCKLQLVSHVCKQMEFLGPATATTLQKSIKSTAGAAPAVPWWQSWSEDFGDESLRSLEPTFYLLSARQRKPGPTRPQQGAAAVAISLDPPAVLWAAPSSRNNTRNNNSLESCCNYNPGQYALKSRSTNGNMEIIFVKNHKKKL